MSTPIHRDPQSAWQYLCKLGGLELDGRDEGLDERIRSRLNPRSRSIEEALDGAEMATFVRAFFESLHPYVAMFRDILDFFEHADATLGESQWTLQVGDIDLNLEHFRKWLASWDSLPRTAITVPAIDANAGWKMSLVLRKYKTVSDEVKASFNEEPQNVSEDVRHWVSAYKSGTYAPMPKSLSPSLCPGVLGKSASIAFVVLQRLLDLRLTPASLKKTYDDQRQPLDPSDGFDFWTIAQHETDFWLRSFVVALSAASRLPESDLTSLGEELDKITESFPVRLVQVDVSANDLESVLSLPIWKKRFDLYSVWVATEIIRALDGHEVQIHHDHGRIAFAFKETVVATIHSSPGPFRLISERRIPMANPRGEGRKGGVQPDHGLWTTKDGNEVCKMVIEVKHYKQSSKAKFVDVFEDYARALPTGAVCLVNHGPTGSAVYEVSKTIRDRCMAISHLNSSNDESRKELAVAVRRCVGEPIPRWPAASSPLNTSKVLLLDVSGSMNTVMRSEAMRSFVRHLVGMEEPAKLVAGDERILGVWDLGDIGFDDLLRVIGGSTHLSQPVAELLISYESVMVITDVEGAATIQGVDVTPHTVQAVSPPGIEVLICRRGNQ